MPNTKISDMDYDGSLAGTELVPIVDGSTNKHTTTQDIADLAAAGIVGHPGFTSGRYYTRPIRSAVFNQIGNVTANRIYAVPFFVPEDTVFTKAAIRVQTAGTAGSQAQFAIYANSDGAPGALTHTVATLATDATGKIELTGLTISLTAGWHWLAIGFSHTPVVWRSGTGDYLTDILGTDLSATTAVFTGVYGSWTFSAGAPPDPFPAITLENGTFPLPFLGL
ncbi:MAG: hypothetical protein AB7H90_03435 [Alphaproteobacteria bacterium]